MTTNKPSAQTDIGSDQTLPEPTAGQISETTAHRKTNRKAELAKTDIVAGDRNKLRSTKPSSTKSSVSRASKSPETRRQTILRLIGRKSGASIETLRKETGWKPHSIRAALSGCRKQGLSISRDVNRRGESVYRLDQS